QKQARCQRASSNKYFNNGLIEDLLEVSIDPDHQHNTESEGESDCDSINDLFDGALSFSLIDGEVRDARSGEDSGSEVENDETLKPRGVQDAVTQ
ncbi:hypothetical protein BDN67DRAFT_973539, partial [Paxillus ammoniavirescens]